jgi:hypothetical protein
VLEESCPEARGGVAEVTLGNLPKFPIGLHLFSGLYNSLSATLGGNIVHMPRSFQLQHF